MADDRRGGSGAGGIGEGLRAGVGILMAFKEAVEASVNEALERGDLSPDRAREVMADASDRLQRTVEEARDRLDMVPRREFEALQVEVTSLRQRLDRLDGATVDTLRGDSTVHPIGGLERGGQAEPEGGPSATFPVD